jgi:hypothetical protein
MSVAVNLHSIFQHREFHFVHMTNGDVRFFALHQTLVINSQTGVVCVNPFAVLILARH